MHWFRFVFFAWIQQRDHLTAVIEKAIVSKKSSHASLLWRFTISTKQDEWVIYRPHSQ